MRVTKERSAENREELIRAASALFRERGVDGVGVAEICDAAGLTHGALYRHFASKEALAAAALDDGLQRGFADLLTYADGARELRPILDFYLSRRQRDTIATSCPMTASASETSRQDEAMSEAYAVGFERIAERIEASLAGDERDLAARDRAIAILAAEIGAIAVARAVKKARPGLSNDVIRAMRRVLGTV